MNRMPGLSAALLAAVMMVPDGERMPRGSHPSPTAGPRERKEWTGSHAKEKARRVRQLERIKEEPK